MGVKTLEMYEVGRELEVGDYAYMCHVLRLQVVALVHTYNHRMEYADETWTVQEIEEWWEGVRDGIVSMLHALGLDVFGLVPWSVWMEDAEGVKRPVLQIDPCGVEVRTSPVW